MMSDRDKQRLNLILTDRDNAYSLDDILVAGMNEIEGRILVIRDYERKKKGEYEVK
jgi:predicted DNA-binding protein